MTTAARTSSPSPGRAEQMAALHCEDVDVVIACFSLDRLARLRDAIDSVLEQDDDRPVHLVVAVDHNAALEAVLQDEYGGRVTIVTNAGIRGASATRNAGAARGSAALLAFLDDDARAQSGWLSSLVALCEAERVIGVGGLVLPEWEGSRPNWFPEEFNWVVGASIGLGESPTQTAKVVRNVWAENMIIRRAAFEAVGGFDESFGKVGSVSRPEDTELCIRTAQAFPAGQWLEAATPVVSHFVPASRARAGFFVRRCFNEGRSKALMASRLKTTPRVLSSEVEYVRALRRAPVRYLARGRSSSDGRPVRQLSALVVGLCTTIAGFVWEYAVGPVIRARKSSSEAAA